MARPTSRGPRQYPQRFVGTLALQANSDPAQTRSWPRPAVGKAPRPAWGTAPCMGDCAPHPCPGRRLADAVGPSWGQSRHTRHASSLLTGGSEGSLPGQPRASSASPGRSGADVDPPGAESSGHGGRRLHPCQPDPSSRGLLSGPGSAPCLARLLPFSVPGRSSGPTLPQCPASVSGLRPLQPGGRGMTGGAGRPGDHA